MSAIARRVELGVEGLVWQCLGGGLACSILQQGSGTGETPTTSLDEATSTPELNTYINIKVMHSISTGLNYHLLYMHIKVPVRYLRS